MLRHNYSKNEVRGQGHSDPKMVCDTPPSQDAYTHEDSGEPVQMYRLDRAFSA